MVRAFSNGGLGVMRKIATTSELQAELRRLLAYAQSARPSRLQLARGMQNLSVRLSAEDEGYYQGEGAEFAALMKEEWNGVKYDPKSGKGSLRYPPLGMLDFHESGSDSAVFVAIKGPIYIKARADDVAAALAKIAKILDDTGL